MKDMRSSVLCMEPCLGNLRWIDGYRYKIPLSFVWNVILHCLMDSFSSVCIGTFWFNFIFILV